VTSKPDADGCTEVIDAGEKLFICDGVIYRPTYYKDEQVYEIVSPAIEEAAAEAETMLGLALTSPFSRGPAVRELQELLVSYGYDTGSVDGTFGKNTEAALMWLQYDYGLEQTGTVDDPTARAMGILPPLPETETGRAATATGATGSDTGYEDEAAPASQEDPHTEVDNSAAPTSEPEAEPNNNYKEPDQTDIEPKE
jgi:peptidoglycan hydrolase-like protein with peptidoglycan-binding domain